MTSIIRNRKSQKLPTYAAFIDFEKAFDRVDRKLLYYKLMKYGIQGKILQCIRNIYDDAKAGVNVNGFITNWFSSECGLFINDIVDDIKNNSHGIMYNDFHVHCLLYADDIVLLSESEQDLQNMIDSLSEWCKKWRMRVNMSKSKIVHFRPHNCNETEFNFNLGGSQLEIVPKYKYLGLIFDYELNFTSTAGVLADSAGRALGAICSKFRSIKGLGYETYTKMYHTGVVPIMDYGAGVGGYGNSLR